jgi:hypothetical protein
MGTLRFSISDRQGNPGNAIFENEQGPTEKLEMF